MKRHILPGTIALIIAGQSSLASAQMLEEVIVTAQKREQNLQEVPIAISAIASEKLEQLRALEHGMRIEVAIVDTVPLGVDTPADLERARKLLAPDDKQ